MSPMLTSAAIGYLLGSLPCGFILVRAFRGEDIRLRGSGNIGATNVARASPLLGILTLVLDALKGVAAVLVVRALFPHELTLAVIGALFAIIGHIFPVWLRLRGGKGVATGMGSFLIIAPKAVALTAIIFMAIVLISRYVSLGSTIATALFPLLAVGFNRQLGAREITLLAGGSALIVVKHHANIHRLMAGTEPRFRLRRG